MIPSLPFLVDDCSTGPSFDALQACVPLFVSAHVHIVPDVLPRFLCGWPRTCLHLLEEGHNHPIVRFAYPCHMIGEELVFLFFLYIKLFELDVEVARKTLDRGCTVSLDFFLSSVTNLSLLFAACMLS